ncbi:MAG TPA: hypothetical protein VGM84_05105 [Steroidobacteraceae bacterium]|jgi:hypothetical protein
MSYAVSFIAHIQAIKECVQRLGGRANCDLDTGALQVRAGGKYVDLSPQYALRHDGSIGYSAVLVNQVEFFAGWRPYRDRAWPIGQDKRRFKEFCSLHGLLTPRVWARPREVTGNALIKHATGSFSKGMAGPFTPPVLKASSRELHQEEFLEEFVQGDIVKAWYWNADPVALEVLPMPTVVGDGKTSLHDLIERKRVAHLPGTDWEVWGATVALQGLGLDSIVAAASRVMVDYRYLSPLHPALPDAPNLNCMAAREGTVLLRHLRDAGPLFWTGIPAESRQDTLYTIDAVTDTSGQPVFLEMNCNPVVHPDAYPPMLDSLFGTPEAPACTH